MEFQNSSACSQVNAAPGHKQKPPGIQLKGTPPFKHLEVDFTEIKHCRHYHYLVVMVCTFSGWVEAHGRGRGAFFQQWERGEEWEADVDHVMS